VHRFDLPPGKTERSWEAQPAVSGRILGLGAHVHRFAVSLRLEDVSAGKVIWETRPTLDANGDVIGMPQDHIAWRFGLPVRAGNVYRITAVYENPTGATIPYGGMGALGGIFVPSRGKAWPAVDTSDDEYLLDVRLTEAGAAAVLLEAQEGVSHTGAAEGAAPHKH
jgi:hypothetical protein